MPGMTNHFRNKLIDFQMRGVAFTPPATYYVRLTSTQPTASAAGTELSGNGYAAQPIAKSAAAWAATNADGSTINPSTGTTGRTSNNVVIDFGVAGANWGTASHWELWDAATGGDRWMFGPIVDGAGAASPRTIVSGDPVKFPVGALRLQF